MAKTSPEGTSHLDRGHVTVFHHIDSEQREGEQEGREARLLQREGKKVTQETGLFLPAGPFEQQHRFKMETQTRN